MRPSLINFVPVLVVMVLLSGGIEPARAHDLIPGVGGFAGRILHPFIIIEHLLCLIMAALIAGLYGPGSLWRSLAVLIGGVLAGFLSQAVIPIIEQLWMLPLAAALITGLMVLSAVPLGSAAWRLVIFLLGFVVGLEYAENFCHRLVLIRDQIEHAV